MTVPLLAPITPELSRSALAPFLFSQLSKVAPWPVGIVAVPAMVEDTAFFPGGTGLWHGTSDQYPDIMVVGQDFSTASEHADMLTGRTRDLDSATWRNFLPLASDVGLDLHRCFFTNAVMGLRSEGSSLGPNPGYRKRNSAFVVRCHEYLRLQFSVVRPRLIIVLGMPAARIFASCCPDLAGWADGGYSQLDERKLAYVPRVDIGSTEAAVVALVHPSYRHANVRIRRYAGHTGHDAELAMMRDALDNLR